jgi:hypothetical protein
MREFWDKDLTEEETEALLEKAAFEVRRRKLEIPAIIALEMHKPLSFVSASAGIALAPFLVPFLGFDFVNEYSQVISKRENIERLIVKLEGPPKTASRSTEDPCPN